MCVLVFSPHTNYQMTARTEWMMGLWHLVISRSPRAPLEAIWAGGPIYSSGSLQRDCSLRLSSGVTSSVHSASACGLFPPLGPLQKPPCASAYDTAPPITSVMPAPLRPDTAVPKMSAAERIVTHR